MLNTSESKNNNNKIKSVTNAPWISLTSASSVCFHTVKLMKKQGVKVFYVMEMMRLQNLECWCKSAQKLKQNKSQSVNKIWKKILETSKIKNTKNLIIKRDTTSL